MFLRPAHYFGDFSVPAAQSAEEVPARWTESVFFDRSAAPCAQFVSYFGGLRFNAVFLDVVHSLLSTGGESLFECCSSLCGKSSGARTALLTWLIT